MSRLVLCADDFGRNPSIDRAILKLVDDGKVTAVSVMVGEPNIKKSAAELASFGYNTDIGLHLTLTDGMALGRYSDFARDGQLPHVDALTIQALLCRIPQQTIAIEVARQFARFLELFGREPDFVDAHQHAHLLPGIRKIVLDAVSSLSPGAWIRTCEDSPEAIFMRGVSRVRSLRSSLLSAGLRTASKRRGLHTNDSFSGLYNMMSDDEDYDRLFPHFLECAGEGNHLVICHPGVVHDYADPIAAARVQEFAYLVYTSVARLAQNAGLELGKFRR
jgi:predicted glycoside hydrolase/deacetylase ChbG (UPF0249 family)